MDLIESMEWLLRKLKDADVVLQMDEFDIITRCVKEEIVWLEKKEYSP